MNLETERLILRRWKESDAENMYEYAKDPAVGPIAGWPPHKSVEESRDIIKNVLSGEEAYAICLKTDHKAIGAIELKLNGHTDMTDRDDECELGYWLGKPFWGQGIMPEAARELLRHAFEDIGMRAVWCGYYDGNAKSKRVQEKVGFVYHHTCDEVPVPLMNEVRVGHTNIMTKEQWEKDVKEGIKMAKQNWKGGNMLNPVPVVMVSVADKAGNANIITIAWAGTVCSEPPMVSISVRPERHSYAMIEETKEFVINLTTDKLVKACDYCGVTSGRDVDKFGELHLTKLDMPHVKAPGIAESPVNIECRVVDQKELGSHTMFIAEIVGVTVDDAYIDNNGKFCINNTGLVAYSHGEYFGLGEYLGKFGYSIAKKK